MKKHLGKILLIVLPIVAAIVLLWPTYSAGRLESLEQEALQRAKSAKTSADSLQIMENFRKAYGEDLKSAKAKRLKLGLDLRGGMYVTMEVDVIKLIEETALTETRDEILKDVIAKTRQEAAGSDEAAMDIFMRNFNAIARPQGKSLLNYFDIGSFKDVSEEKVVEKLNENINQAIEQAQEVIRQRIDQYGVSEPNITKQGTRRIVLELPGVQNPDEMKSLLSTTARLEFKLVRNNRAIVEAFARIDKFMSDNLKRSKGLYVEETPVADTTKTVAADTTKTAKKADAKKDLAKNEVSKKDASKAKTGDTAKVAGDTAGKKKDPYAGLSDDQKVKKYTSEHPFTSLFSTFFMPANQGRIQPVEYTLDQYPDGEYMFRIPKDSIAKFRMLLSRPEIAMLIPGDLEVAIDAKPDQQILKQNNVEIYDFYSLKKESELTGEVIVDAKSSFDHQTNAPVVSMTMSADGSESWARITGANLKKRIAVVLDGRVYTAPTVQNKITGGSSQITGMANTEEAHLLEIVLKAGALKAPVQIIEERVVGPSLGEDSINAGFMASLVAILLVVLFMAFYYRTGGLVADIAVIINVLLILAVLAALKGTLSLPGIAGIILTMGMAVDANVLIFERIREELAVGRSLRSAIDEGFKMALSAIIDSNVTTFISGVILYYMGSGSIQGFALTLMIGIVFTMFTAIWVSKAMIELMLRNGATSFDFGQPKINIG